MANEMNDHDVLIEMRTILRGVVDDFRAYRLESHKEITSLSTQIAALEKAKTSIIDFAAYQKASEIRFKRLEQGYWAAMGIVVAIQFLAPFFTSHLGL